MFVYVKGPSVVNGVGAEYYIDDFSLVVQGSDPVDFSITGDIIDIGAFEYISPTMSLENISDSSNQSPILFPNPSSEKIFIKYLNGNEYITVYDISGRLVRIFFENLTNIAIKSADISSLEKGMYLLVISDPINKKKNTIPFIKRWIV